MKIRRASHVSGIQSGSIVSNIMEPIGNIIKLPEKKSASERAKLIGFFIENLSDKNGKPFSSRMVAVKLSHIPTPDLYYFVSCCKDRKNRGENWQKYFWGSLKPKEKLST